MTDSSDYRLFLESKFEGLTVLMNAHAHDTHDRLDTLNGSVSKNQNRIAELEKADLAHIIECPVKADVIKIEKSLLEYNFLRKYPKIAIGIVVVSVIMGIYSVRKWITEPVKELQTQMDMMNTPVMNTRSGKYELWPSGMIMDSIKTQKDKTKSR